MQRILAGFILALALTTDVKPANSVQPDHQARRVVASEWLNFTAEEKLWWVRGYIEGASAGFTAAFYRFGIIEPEQNALAVRNTVFSRCASGRSSAELVATFDRWLQEHPEDWKEGIHAVFFSHVVNQPDCQKLAP